MGMCPPTTTTRARRAAAAGGVTCLVDFSIQREPDNLRSALAEWQGRAEGAAHVDYGFHMAITNANEATLDEMELMIEAGVCTFKLFMAYKGELMVRDDELAAAMERARDLGGLIMVHAENGDVVDLLVKRALARGDTSAINHALTRPEFVEAEATGRAARLAEYTGASLFVVHVTCAAAAAEIEAAQQRGAHVSAETCTQYLVNTIDDLRRRRRRGRPLHLLAAAARRLQPRAAVGLRPPRRARERLDRPLPVQLRAEVARAGQLQPRAERAAGRSSTGWRSSGTRASSPAGSRRASSSTARARRSRAASGSTTRARSRPARTPTSASSTRRRRAPTASTTRS